MSGEGLRLESASLMSKWGFNDGDVPDTVYDLWDEQGIDGRGVDWPATLVSLVREFLLPALDQSVEVYEVDGGHNPIRAESVDGAPVDDYNGAGTNPRITPDGVTVPWSTVLGRCREAVR